MNADPGLSRKPVNLHLAHSWGGGLGRWTYDFASADRFAENLVLESFGSIECYGAGLRLTHPIHGTELGQWVLPRPVSEIRASDPSYAALLADLCQDYGVSHIYVSSLVGQTLDVFRLGLPVTLIYHDYFSYCPALYLTRGGVCTSCNREDLIACKNRSTGHRPKGSPEHYFRLRDSFFEAVAKAEVTHVTPSHSLIDNLRRIDDRFESIDFHVIEHGISYEKKDYFGGADDDRRLRVGLLGVLSWNKGHEVFERHFETLRLIADLHLIGAHDPGAAFADRWHCSVLHQYSQEQMPSILEQHRLDLAIFLSQVPETFSYTLSEAWCFGIPPAARRIGAHGERIRHGETGFLFDLGDEEVIDFLLWVDGERDAIRRVAGELSRQPVRTIQQAVDAYYFLRSDYFPALESCLDHSLHDEALPGGAA